MRKSPSSRLVFLFIISLTTFFHCKKEKKENPLPPATQTGAGTFGFKVGDQVYKQDYPKAVVNYLHLQAPFTPGYFINIKAQLDTRWVFAIVTDSLRYYQGETYPLNNHPNHAKGKAFAYAWFGDSLEYFCLPQMQGEVHISKFDTLKGFMSGTFWFDAIDTGAGKVVQIREGRFDLPYTQ